MNNEGLLTEDQEKSPSEAELPIAVEDPDSAGSFEIKSAILRESNEKTSSRIQELRNDLDIGLQQIKVPPVVRRPGNEARVRVPPIVRVPPVVRVQQGSKNVTVPPVVRMSNTEDQTKFEVPDLPEVEDPSLAHFSEEKIERLEALNRAKNQVGILFTDEENERVALASEYEAAYRKYIRNVANSAPASIKFESPVEIYNEEDVLKWKSGAQKFKEFTRILQSGQIQEKFKSIFNPIALNELKALFLKEKAVVLLDPMDLKDSDNMVLLKLLQSFGVENNGRFLYDRDQVKNIIEKNEVEFKSFGHSEPDEVIKVVMTNDTIKNHLILGTLLGFPTDSARAFEYYTERERRGIKRPKSDRVNVYGIQWASFADSLEGRLKQARLKSAFELSGILKL